MRSPDPTAQIAALGIEPTYYSAREAALLLGRSYSWLDQRLRAGQFMLPDGTTVQPLRTPGAVGVADSRRFTTEMLKDIAICSRTTTGSRGRSSCPPSASWL